MSSCRASLSGFCGRHSLVGWVMVSLSEHRGQSQAPTPEASLISMCVCLRATLLSLTWGMWSDIPLCLLEANEKHQNTWVVVMGVPGWAFATITIADTVARVQACRASGWKR